MCNTRYTKYFVYPEKPPTPMSNSGTVLLCTAGTVGTGAASVSDCIAFQILREASAGAPAPAVAGVGGGRGGSPRRGPPDLWLTDD